ncbi:MAG: prephenate dehydrogenase dimerization domain-containing protein, partial [Candidatus Limnocylindrales bacterium]
VRALARACGARPLDLGADEHDRAVAIISHLPLLVSVALAETALDDEVWPIARRLAAQGFRDTTRLARGDPTLGAGIMATNPAAVADALGRLGAVLDAWRADLVVLAEAMDDGSIAEAASDGSRAGTRDLRLAARVEGRLARVRAGLGTEVRLP